MHPTELNHLLAALEEDQKQLVLKFKGMQERSGKAHEMLARASMAPPRSEDRDRLIKEADALFDEVTSEFIAFRETLKPYP
jgi:hypothetical protein